MVTMKKFLAGLLAGLLVAALLATAAPALAGIHGQFQGLDMVRMFVDGREVQGDTPAVILGGRTMVPVRFVSEALGAKVNWDESGQAVSITRQQQATTSKDLLDAIQKVMKNSKERLAAFPGPQDKVQLIRYTNKGWIETQNDMLYILKIFSGIPSPSSNTILATSSVLSALNQEIIFYAHIMGVEEAMEKGNTQFLTKLKADMEAFKKSSHIVPEFQIGFQRMLEKEVDQQQQTNNGGYSRPNVQYDPKTGKVYINGQPIEGY